MTDPVRQSLSDFFGGRDMGSMSPDRGQFVTKDAAIGKSGPLVGSSHSLGYQRLSAGGSDAHAGDLDLAIAGADALAAGDGESCADDLDEQLDGKAVREQHGLGGAIGAAGEQRQHPAVLRGAYAAELTSHGARDSWCLRGSQCKSPVAEKERPLFRIVVNNENTYHRVWSAKGGSWRGRAQQRP